MTKKLTAYEMELERKVEELIAQLSNNSKPVPGSFKSDANGHVLTVQFKLNLPEVVKQKKQSETQKTQCIFALKQGGQPVALDATSTALLNRIYGMSNLTIHGNIGVK